MTCFLISSYVFRCTCTTVDLLSVVSDRFARAFDRSGSTRAVALEIYKAFDSIYHAGVFHKLSPMVSLSNLFLHFLSDRLLCVILLGKSLRECPINPLSANTTNCLIVFGHFVELGLKGLTLGFFKVPFIAKLHSCYTSTLFFFKFCLTKHVSRFRHNEITVYIVGIILTFMTYVLVFH